MGWEIYAPFLRDLRDKQKLSMRAAARRIGISVTYLSQLESGKKRPPGVEIIEKLAKTYKINPVEIAFDYRVKKSGTTDIRMDEAYILQTYRKLPFDKKKIFKRFIGALSTVK